MEDLREAVAGPMVTLRVSMRAQTVARLKLWCATMGVDPGETGDVCVWNWLDHLLNESRPGTRKAIAGLLDNATAGVRCEALERGEVSL